MKLLIDQNLSPKLVKQLNTLFPNSLHIQEISLEKANDLEVWEYAQKNDFIIISKDVDFINIHSVYGFPPKIISIQKGNCSTKAILKTIKNHFDIITSFHNDSHNGVLIIT